VIIKSPDAIARWEDTRALFDRGFDEFISFRYKAEEFAADGYKMEFSGGGKAELNLIPSGDFNCLISKSIKKEDIKTDYIFFTDETTGKINAKTVFSLESASGFMYKILGETEMWTSLISETLEKTEKPAETEMKNPSKTVLFSVYGVISVILQIIGIIAVIFIVLYIIQYVRVRKIKKQKRNFQINKNIYKK
jgi:hypothetical protein